MSFRYARIRVSPRCNTVVSKSFSEPWMSATFEKIPQNPTGSVAVAGAAVVVRLRIFVTIFTSGVVLPLGTDGAIVYGMFRYFGPNTSFSGTPAGVPSRLRRTLVATR